MKKEFDHFRLMFLRIFKTVVLILGYIIFIFLCVLYPIEYIVIGEKKGILDWVGNKLDNFVYWEPK